MMRSVAYVVLVTGLAASAAFAADPPSTASAPAGSTPSTDTFVQQVAIGNQFEIDTSKLALSKSNSADVKSFATRMVKDHGDAAIKFKKAVSDARLKEPSTSPDDKHEAIVKDLKAKSGGDFDKVYAGAQKQAHVETVALFESYAKAGDNDRMKQFARELLPTLREHLEHARKLNPS